MPSVILRPSGGFTEFDQPSLGPIAPGDSEIREFRDYILDGTDLPTDVVIDQVEVSTRGRHLTESGSFPIDSVQRRWVTAGGDASSDWENADWPFSSSSPSDTYATPGAGVCTGLSYIVATHPSGLDWTRANLLAASWGFDLGWRTEPTSPGPWTSRGAHTCDLFVTVQYHAEADPEPPDPPPDLPSVPCCCNCPETTSPSGPVPSGPVVPPDTVEHHPQCIGGGDLPVYEALVDSEMYL